MKFLHLKATLPALAFTLAVALTGCGFGSSSSSSPTATPKPTATPAALGLISSGHLTVGTDADYAPMESTKPGTTTYVGVDIDLAGALAKAMGLQGVKFVDAYFDTLTSGLEQKKFDVIMSAMSNTPQRQQTMAFVDYMRSSEAIVVKKSSGIYAKNYDQLCGKTVAVQSGTTELEGLTTANQHCQPPITIKQFSSNPEAYSMFHNGQAQAYTADGVVADSYIKQNSALVLAGKPFATDVKYGIGLLPANTALKDGLQRALAEIRKNGEYASILARWGVGNSSL
jgi:polar amino acid transport system substrate-binding protein